MDLLTDCGIDLSEAELLTRTLHASVPEHVRSTEIGYLQAEEYEQIRMRRLRELNLLNTAESEGYDRITRMAARMFQTPIAAVSLTDEHRQWFKSYIGCPDREIPRLGTPCAAVTSLARPVVINDMASHEAFQSCRLVEAGLRFYAGAPLMTREGHVLGAFCVLDQQERSVTPEQIELLKDFAAMIMAQIELEHDFGRRDPVCGLPNRNQLAEDLADLKRRHPKDTHSIIAIELGDPARLSQTVGVLGTDFLDSLLQSSAIAVTDVVGSPTGLYYAGPASLALLRPLRTGDDCRQLLEDLRIALSKPLLHKGIPVAVEPTMGISPFCLDTLAINDVLRTGLSAAQDARNKESQLSYYSPESDEIKRRRLLMLTRVQKALHSGDQFRLVYQPRIDLKSGACVGAEALLRWRSPDLGDVPPGEFIPLVEETALMEDLTEWVLSESVRQIAAWMQTGLHLRVSLNVSARNLAQDGFAASVAAAMTRSGVSPRCVELEFTEGVLISEASRTLAHLADLRKLGLKLAIDDFGTGYSSFSYLKSIPADVVKIDRSFVRGLDSRDMDRRLVRSMIAMARDLGFTTVAEGVETLASCQVLHECGCDEVQGYYLSRPLEPDQFQAWYLRRSRIGAGPQNDSAGCLSATA